MNIHPLFVHFPIALLVVYSIFELGGYLLPALRRQSWLSSVKAFLLFTGVLSAFIALVTGGITEELLRAEGDANFYMVENHSLFAGVTTVLYLILAAVYFIRIFDKNGWGSRIVGTNKFLMWVWDVKRFVAHLILDTWFLPVLAFLALVGMIVTGALGAAIVYGPDVDPFVSFVYHLFWIQ